MRIPSAVLLFLAAPACEEGEPITVGDPPGWVPNAGADSGDDCVEGYLDADGDGYAGTAATICDGSAVLEPDDCDDTDPAVNPGTHTCGLYGAVTVDEANATLTGDEGYSEVGHAMADAGDLDGDGVADLVVGASQRTGLGGEEESGRAYIVRGPARGERSLSTAEAAIVSEVTDEHLGKSVAGLGDADGDGYPELLLGTQWTSGTTESHAWLFYGPIPDGTTLATEGVALTMRQSSMWFIASSAGDADGDGQPDLVLGAPKASTTTTYAGAVLLVLGPTDEIGDLEATAEAVIQGTGNGDYLGYDLAGEGDPNGDGVPDLLVGVPGLDGDPTVTHAGAAYLYDGPVSGTIAAEDASAIRLAEGSRIWQAGHAVAHAGDVDADGYDDVLVGAPGEDSSEAYLHRGPVSGRGALADATATFLSAIDCGIAWDVAGGQDLDGDGRDDYAVDGCHVAHVFYEPVEGAVVVTTSSARLNVDPYDDEGGAGCEKLEMVADTDGAGTPGVLVGTPNNVGGHISAGTVWLYLGN